MSFFILANDILFYLLNNKFRDNTSYKQMYNIRRLIKNKRSASNETFFLEDKGTYWLNKCILKYVYEYLIIYW